jgi:hypothetical protein
VTLVEEAGNRWLLAPYGEVKWVRNARTAGRITLCRGGRSATFDLHELAPREAGDVLRR